MTYGPPLILAECKGHEPTKHQFCLIQIKEIYDKKLGSKNSENNLHIIIIIIIIMKEVCLRKLTKNYSNNRQEKVYNLL